jgi:alginate O-acetyltransferase complex protein AlgI
MAAEAADPAPVVRMVATIGLLFLAMKIVVALEWRARTRRPLAARRWMAFLFAWPGMDPAVFEPLGAPTPEDRGIARAHLRRGALAGLGGAALWRAAVLLAGAGHEAAALVLACVAFSLLVHFGLFALLSAFWSARGLPAPALFDRPLLSRSLREFWGRRWNRPFTEMTAALVHRPVARRAGRTAGLAASFAFSGVLHELAVSTPVGAGYGGPFAYFMLHALLVALEERGLRLGRAGTLAALVLPLPALFHPPFLRGIVWPLLT